MYYAIENEDGTFNRRVADWENVVWDDRHYCTVAGLTDEDRVTFHVFPYQTTTPPTPARWFDVREIAPVKTDGTWYQQWEVYDLGLTFDEKVADTRTLITNYSMQAYDAIAQSVDFRDLAAFQLRYDEIRLYASTKQASDAPFLSTEASVRGISLDALIPIVEARFKTYMDQCATVFGLAGKYSDLTDAAKTDADIAAIDPTVGWPGL